MKRVITVVVGDGNKLPFYGDVPSRYEIVETRRSFIDWWNLMYGGRPVIVQGEGANESLGEGYDVRRGWVVVDASGTLVKAVRRTNPNAKWDYWQVGGRWNHFFTLKYGSTSSYAKKGFIDFAAMQDREESEARQRWDEAHAALQGRTWIKWNTLLETYGDDVQGARKAYWAQDGMNDVTSKLTYYLDFDGDVEACVKKARQDAIRCFAFLDATGWHEKGKLGWFACVSNENENWGERFEELLASVPGDAHLVVVDCHI